MHRADSRSTTFEVGANASTATRVVVAEDDPDLRDMICDVLRADGYHVDVACDGRELTALVEAVIRADGRPPQMIISDVRMPGRTGLEALALLRPLLSRTAVLLITGFGDEAVLSEARRCGAIGVLSKPFDLDDLRMIVSSARSAP